MARKLDSIDLKQIRTLHLDGKGISKYDLKELQSFDNSRLDSLFPSLTTFDN
jgi:hypothetical protein